MTGFKRGGARGGAFKKSYTKKRAASDDEDSPAPTSKKNKGGDDDEEDSTPFIPELKTNDDEEKYVSLNASGKRRVTVREFKSNLLVDIREYWSNDGGELKPGKKGISLNLDQYNALVASLPLLEAAFAEKKVQPARPDYDAVPSAAKTGKDKDEDIPEEEDLGGVTDDGEEE